MAGRTGSLKPLSRLSRNLRKYGWRGGSGHGATLYLSTRYMMMLAQGVRAPLASPADGKYDVPGFPLRFHVPGRLDHVLQRVAPIDDRPVFTFLDELLEEADVLLWLSRWYLKYHPLGSLRRRHERPYEICRPVGW